MKKTLNLVALFVICMGPAFAQEAADSTSALTAAAPAVSNTSTQVVYFLLVTFVLLAAILLYLSIAFLRAFNSFAADLQVGMAGADGTQAAAYAPEKRTFLQRLLGLKPLSHEKDIMLEHKFDDIAELDNPIPGWFNWLFFATIAFGVFYLMNYHIFKWSPLQKGEYVAELKQAEADKLANLGKAANLIDENTVKEDTAPEVISAGQSIFTTNCVACHGDKGQGGVGPNLTDEFWLHGGKVSDIFKTVKYGVPEKGMVSWEKTLSPKQISDVSNYILSLKGTNPPGAKAPQGEKEA